MQEDDEMIMTKPATSAANIKTYKVNSLFMNQYRIEIMNMLIDSQPLRFNVLKNALGLTDGNLASHLRALEKGGAIVHRKEFIGRIPATFYRRTGRGRIEFLGFKKDMRMLLIMQGRKKK